MYILIYIYTGKYLYDYGERKTNTQAAKVRSRTGAW